MDFPNAQGLPITVWTGGPYGVNVGARAIANGSAAFVSTAWATANLAIYVPIFLPFRYPVRNLFCYNFATLGGNVDVRVYNSEYVALTASVATAQAGASGLQFFAADVVLAPGQYYLGLSSSSTTATFACAAVGTATRERYMGLTQQATAHPLPSPATPATVANARIPAIGMTYLTGTPAF